MRILSKTEFWKNLWDYMPEWSEDQSGGGGAGNSLGEDEDQIGEEYTQAQAQDATKNEGQNQDEQSDSDSNNLNERDQSASSDGEPNNNFPPNKTGKSLSSKNQDDNNSGEGPEEAKENSREDSQNDPVYGIDKPPVGEAPLLGYHLETDAHGTENHIREFASWWDFVQCAGDDSLRAWTKSYSSHARQISPSTGFNRGTKDFQEALDMALRTGWPEGRKMLDDQITTAIRHQHLVDNWSFDVAGAFPMVPLFCAGDPACMVVDPMSDLKTQTPIVRIDYNFAVNWITPIKSIMTRGAAVVSLANNLERQGIQTELRIISNMHGRNGRQNFRLSVVYKRAGERLDLDRTAFAIAHPSVLRRLSLAIMEQHKAIEDQFYGNYGVPLHEPNDPTSGTSGGAIFIRGAVHNETPESARKAVEMAAQAVLTSHTTERRAA